MRDFFILIQQFTEIWEWYGGKDLYTAFPICRGHFRIQEHANGLYCGVLTITAEKYNVAEGVMDWYSLYNTNGVWWIRTCRPPDQDARYCLESLKELQTAESAEGQWRIDSILPELKSRGLLCGSDESEFAGCVRLKTCYLLAFRHSDVGEYYVRVAIPSGEAHRVRVPGGKLDLMAYPRCPFASRYLPIRNDSETWIYLWDSESEDIVSGPNPSARFCRSCGHETFLSEDGNGHLYVWRAPQDDFKHWRKDERFVYRFPAFWPSRSLTDISTPSAMALKCCRKVRMRLRSANVSCLKTAVFWRSVSRTAAGGSTCVRRTVFLGNSSTAFR